MLPPIASLWAARRRPLGTVAAVFALLALGSCNRLLGLDDVRPASGDGGAGDGGAGAEDAAGVADVGPDGEDANVDGGPSCGRELLLNPTFDTEMPWLWLVAPPETVLIRKDDDAEVTAHGVMAQSGRYLALLGGPKHWVVNWLERPVVLPADASQVTISGFILIKTDEDADGDYDVGYVDLVEESDSPGGSAVFRSSPVWSNRTPAPVWTPFSYTVDVAAYAGTERLHFRVVTVADESTATYFFFDSLSVTVSGCGTKDAGDGA